MKKTINVNLGGKLFHIDEDAYSKLEVYLSEVRTHFSKYEDASEIVADIESRIAEQLSEQTHSQAEAIVTLSQVENVIGIMGSAKDFGSEEETPHEKAGGQEPQNKKLYRDMDDKIIAGVASGLARYFGIESIWVRLIFVLTVIFGGWGVIVYFVLFLLVPEAKTPSEKAQMTGKSSTLKDIENALKKNLNKPEIKQGVQKAGSALGQVFTELFKLLRSVVKVFIRVIATFIAIGFGAAIVGLLIGAVTLALTGNANSIEFPIREFLGAPLFFTALASVFFVAFVPLMFLLLASTSAVSWRNNFRKGASLGLIVLWIVAVSVTAGLGITHGPRVQEFVQNSPAYKQEMRVLELKDFTRIVVRNDVLVNFHTDAVYKVEVKAVELDQRRLKAEVVDGTLTITKEFNTDSLWCIFCPHMRPEITISAPNIESILAGNGVTVEGHITGTSMHLQAENGSRLELDVQAEQVDTVVQNGSKMTLTGNSSILNSVVENGSKLEAGKLSSEVAGVTATSGSRATVNASKTLYAESRNGSRIYYYGSPEVTGPATQIEETHEVQPIQPVPPIE